MTHWWDSSGYNYSGTEYQGVIAIKEYFTFSKALGRASPSDCLVRYPGYTLGTGFILLQRYSRYMLQPQPTNLRWSYEQKVKKNKEKEIKKWTNDGTEKNMGKKLRLSLIGIILRWGFLIWELIFLFTVNFLYSSFVLFLLHHVSAKCHLWPSSGDQPRPQIGMLSLVTVSPVITAFHSCCLSHHVFDQVKLWPAWVGIETAIFWQCSPGTVETRCLYPLNSKNLRVKKFERWKMQVERCNKK